MSTYNAINWYLKSVKLALHELKYQAEIKSAHQTFISLSLSKM